MVATHDMADNSSISSPSLDYGGVQTPDSSPHGSPISSALNPQSNDIIYNNNNNRFNQHSPRSFYHNHNNYTANSTTGQQLSSIGSMNNSIQSSSGRQTTATTLVMNDQISLTNPLDYPPPPPLSSLSQQGKGNSRETIKSLPTPELSPVENDLHHSNHHHHLLLHNQQHGYGLHTSGSQHHPHHHHQHYHSPMNDLHTMYPPVPSSQQQSIFHHNHHTQQQQQFHHAQTYGVDNNNKSLATKSLANTDSELNNSNQKSSTDPFNELLNRFSGSSTFLRNVCPPYSYRHHQQQQQQLSPPNQQSDSSSSAINTVGDDQRNCSPYSGMEKSPMNYPYDQPPAQPRSMLQHQLELPINNNESSSSVSSILPISSSSSSYHHHRSWSTPIESSMMMNQTLYGYSSMYNHNNNIKNESKPELSMYTGNVYQSNDTNLYYGQNNFEIGGNGDGRISNSNNDPNIAFHYGTNNINNNNSPGSNPIISNELHSDLISTSGNGGMEGTATSISSSLLTTATPTTTPTTTMNNYNHCDSSSNSELIAALAETREIIS